MGEEIAENRQGHEFAMMHLYVTWINVATAKSGASGPREKARKMLKRSDLGVIGAWRGRRPGSGDRRREKEKGKVTDDQARKMCWGGWGGGVIRED